MINHGKRHSFTLMETMIAATILAFSVAAVLSILGGARGNLIRAKERWTRQHLVAQAAEVFLLGGPNAQLPEGTLPEGYSASCEVAEVEDIPEDALEANRGWILAEYHIVVYGENGDSIGETKIRKVLKEEDLE